MLRECRALFPAFAGRRKSPPAGRAGVPDCSFCTFLAMTVSSYEELHPEPHLGATSLQFSKNGPSRCRVADGDCGRRRSPASVPAILLFRPSLGLVQPHEDHGPRMKLLGNRPGRFSTRSSPAEQTSKLIAVGDGVLFVEDGVDQAREMASQSCDVHAAGLCRCRAGGTSRRLRGRTPRPTAEQPVRLPPRGAANCRLPASVIFMLNSPFSARKSGEAFPTLQ